MIISALCSKFRFGKRAEKSRFAAVGNPEPGQLDSPQPPTRFQALPDAQTAPATPARASPNVPASDARFELYDRHNPLPVAEVTEHTCDSTWALFDNVLEPDDGVARIKKLHQRVDSSLRDDSGIEASAVTVPSTFFRGHVIPSSGPGRTGARLIALDDVIAIARKGNRACPKPEAWRCLYALLCQLPVPAASSTPPPPLSAAVWNSTPFLTKRLALRAQMEWAKQVGFLAEIHEYMVHLPDSEWEYYA